jgi:hypothetical protein
MNPFDRRHVEKMTSPFGSDINHDIDPGDNDSSIAKAHAASIALAIKGASDSVTSELGSIDQRLGQVLVGLDQLERIVDKLDKISERIDVLEVTG